MAVYEPESDRIVVRVVYDGPGRSGKTTNVEQLARIFGTKSGAALQVHAAASGRTQMFDWFSFDGGLIDGHHLEIQIVAVPGHHSLEQRRARILRTADVVVIVCDSAPSGLDSARETLASLREHLGAREVPRVIQANKQDLPRAPLPHEYGAQLGLGGDVPVVGAQASAGIGVRETVIHAIRAGVREMKRRTPGRDLSPIVGRAGTCDDLRQLLEAAEAPPPAAPEDMPPRPPDPSEQVAPLDRPVPETIPEPTPLPEPAAHASPAPEAAAAAPAASPAVDASRDPSLPSVPEDAQEPTTTPPVTEVAVPTPTLVPEPPVPPDSLSVPPEHPVPPDILSVAPNSPVPPDTLLAVSAPPVSPDSLPVPPVAPRRDVPSGHVWPVPDGRRVLERLAGHTLVPVPPAPGAVDHLFHAAGLCLRTRPQWRYPDAAQGADALRTLVRGFARLGALRPRGLTVALAVDDDGSAVLWHIVPQRPSLADALRAEPNRPWTLVRLATAHVSALQLAAREGLVMRLAADAFALQEGHLIYTAADLDPRGQRLDLAARLVDALERLALRPAQLDTYAETLAEELPDSLTRADVATLGLHEGLATAIDGPARACVGEALRRCV